MAKKTEAVDTQAEFDAATPQPEAAVVDTREADGLRNYLAYGAALQFKTLKGEPLEAWEHIHPLERTAWINAAFAVRTG